MVQLRAHKILVHNFHPCQNCDETFGYKTSLDIHMRKGCRKKSKSVQIPQSPEIESEIVDNETIVKIKPSKNSVNFDKEKPENVRSTEEPNSSDSQQRSESYGDNLDKDSLTEIDASDKKQSEIDKNSSLKNLSNDIRETQTTRNIGNVEDYEFEFEQPLKKIKLEDQSGNEIQRLHETIKNLKEENLMLSKEVSDVNDQKITIQKQSRDEIQRLQTTIKNLKEDNLKLYKEVSNYTDLNVQVQKQAQIINTLKEKNLKLYEENANLKYGGQ